MRRCGLILALAASSLFLPSSAGAAVTLGSPLTAPVSVFSGPTTAATFVNTAIPEFGAVVKAPTDGTIVRWRLVGTVGGQFSLGVLHPVGGDDYVGSGTTSAVGIPQSTGVQTFPTNLPIKAGDLIAINTSAGTSVGVATVPGARYVYFNTPFTDNSQRTASTNSDPDTELAFNADLATVPANHYTFGKVKKNKNNGTASLAVDVPGPGTLSLTGKGVKAQRLGRQASASKTVSAAGIVKLLIKAKGKAKTKLNKTGKAKVKVRVTYKPTGDLPGTPSTQTKRVKLIKRQ
jgi:hypothetical protein